MGAIGGAGFQSVVVGGELGRRAPRDVHVLVAPEDMAELEIRRGEVIAGEEGCVRLLVVGDGEVVFKCVQRRPDGFGILLSGCGSDDASEDRAGEAVLGVELGPFCPFVDLGAGGAWIAKPFRCLRHRPGNAARQAPLGPSLLRAVAGVRKGVVMKKAAPVLERPSVWCGER